MRPQNVVVFVPTGTDSITGTPSPALFTYEDLVEVQPVMLIAFYAAGDNTGPVTIDLNGLGPVPLCKLNGAINTPLVAGDIREHQYVMATWYPIDGFFQMLTPLGNVPSAPYWQILSYQGDLVSTAFSDPGTGMVRWNATTPQATTQIIFDRLDAGADDVTMMWQMVKPTRIVIQDAGLALNWQEWVIGPMQAAMDFFFVTATFVQSAGTGGGNFRAPGDKIRIVVFLMREPLPTLVEGSAVSRR